MGESAWKMTWYDEDVEFQNLIRLMIMRTQKPVGVTAAGFYFISLQSYSNVSEKSILCRTNLRNYIILGT